MILIWGFVLSVVRAADLPSGVAVPRVDGIVIDGNAADWHDNGLKIDVLASSVPRTPGTFDAWARLGWDERGLLILINVLDEQPQE